MTSSPKGGGEEVVTHGLSDIAVDQDIFVLETNGRPSLDGKALVLRSCVVVRDKVGQSTGERRTELLIRGKSWLEEDRTESVIVKCLDVTRRLLHVVSTIRISGGNRYNAVSPCGLGCLDQVFGHARGS